MSLGEFEAAAFGGSNGQLTFGSLLLPGRLRRCRFSPILIHFFKLIILNHALGWHFLLVFPNVTVLMLLLTSAADGQAALPSSVAGPLLSAIG